MAEIRREYNFRSEKSFLIIKKVILASLNANSGGKHRNATNRSLVERQILSRHISKSRTQNFLKFCILNSLMLLIMCTKSQINRIILILFSGMWDKNPTPVAEKVVKCRRQ